MSDGGVWSYVKPFLIGSLSGCIASAVIQPIDTIKVVIQNKREVAGRAQVNLSPFAVGRQIVVNNGVVGLYKGLDSSILRQFLYCGLRLGIYRYFEDRAKYNEKRNLSFAEKFSYSMIAGAIGSFIANPTDVALIRFQSDNSLPVSERRNYNNVFDAFKRIYREEGINGLWKGSVPTIARAMAVNSSQMIAYNEGKQFLINKFKKKEDMGVRLIASAAAGVATTLLALPFDNIKTKIMRMKPNKQGILPYSGFVNCLIKSIANEGIIGLWVGTFAFYTRVGPHAMLIVISQDFLHDLFSKRIE